MAFTSRQDTALLRRDRRSLEDFALNLAEFYFRSFWPILGKTNAINLGLGAELRLFCLILVHNLKLSYYYILVLVILRLFLCNILCFKIKQLPPLMLHKSVMNFLIYLYETYLGLWTDLMNDVFCMPANGYTALIASLKSVSPST